MGSIWQVWRLGNAMHRSRMARVFIAMLLLGMTLVSSVPSQAAIAAPAAQAPTLTLYNAQHVPVAEAWANAFTTQTGIKVQIRSGRDLELANLLIEEGDATPADVFITENSPAMS